MIAPFRRRFSLRAVLYVTTGGPTGLVDGPGLVEVQDLLTFMTGSPARLALNQIPRAADVCQKYLRDQFGWLHKMQPTPSQLEDSRRLGIWLRACEKERGETLAVIACPGGAYSYMDPVVEFCQQMADGRGATAAAGARDA